MGRMQWVLLFALCALVHVSAHLCMIQPRQRGEFDISKPGLHACYRKVGPCGLDDPGPVTQLVAGQAFTVWFQQNLNHYYVGNPGYMDVSYAKGLHPSEADFMPLTAPGPVPNKLLASGAAAADSAPSSPSSSSSSSLPSHISDYNAMNEITQTNFSVEVTVPAVECAQCVVRVRYVSQNPQEEDHGQTFYQCADVRIVAKSSSSSSSSFSGTGPGTAAATPAAAAVSAPLQTASELFAKTAAKGSAVPAGCCTSTQWQAQFYRVGSYASGPIAGAVYYDAVRQQLRVDAVIGTGVSVYDGSFVMLMNFTSQASYLYNVHNNSCDLHYVDFWNDWCYGTLNQSESYLQNMTVGSATCDAWRNGEFVFVHERATCRPVFLLRANGDTTVYTDYSPGIADPSVFVAPAVCPPPQPSDVLKARKRARAATDVGGAVPAHVALLREIAHIARDMH